MDPKIIKKTQDTLGKIIKKPPLTEKLLSKPPFRFLHDIVTEVIKTTGFCKGLYTASEMDSKNVTAKDDKLLFLQKLIDCVSFASGSTISARPSKIIAGHEPDKTNELLQVIARCIKKNISSAEAIEKVNKGKTTKSSKPKDKSESKQESGSKEDNKESEKKSRHDRGGEPSERKREASADKRRRSSDRRKESELEQRNAGEKHEEREERKRNRSRKRHEERPEEDTSSPSVQQEDAEMDAGVQPDGREASDGAEQSAPSRSLRPASAKGQRRRPPGGRSAIPDGQADSPEEPPAAPRKLVRPPSARPAAPRVRQKRDPAEEEIARIDSGGQQRTAPVIIDNGLNQMDSDDDDEQFVVEEDDNTTLQFEQPMESQRNGENEEDDGEHGGLVRKILETKKELEHSGGKHAGQKHTEIQRSNVATAQQQKERQLVVKEIDRLRDSVQKLCQSATPLAKIIDYIQEDMDAMQTELQLWQKENKEHALRLKEEESVTTRGMEPLKLELEAAEQEIISYKNQTAATKANIIRNQDKINKMIMAVATRS
uniref:TRAF3-interacting protein 1 n=1 Tax=Phallusia mammillata TaxID=59560 RepID=A0A6F9DVQ0_9ASCI|nr:TRAF3-interacting protein 1-like [Phallusia mammillata]